MLDIDYSSAFKQDYKRCQKRGYNLSFLFSVLDDLVNERKLDERYRDHPLSGNWKEHRELHILPDWLLIYYVENGVLYCSRTGTHSDLFNK